MLAFLDGYGFFLSINNRLVQKKVIPNLLQPIRRFVITNWYQKFQYGCMINCHCWSSRIGIFFSSSFPALPDLVEVVCCRGCSASSSLGCRGQRQSWGPGTDPGNLFFYFSINYSVKYQKFKKSAWSILWENVFQLAEWNCLYVNMFLLR